MWRRVKDVAGWRCCRDVTVSDSRETSRVTDGDGLPVLVFRSITDLLFDLFNTGAGILISGILKSFLQTYYI